jgi:hypothetical protein
MKRKMKRDEGYTITFYGKIIRFGKALADYYLSKGIRDYDIHIDLKHNTLKLIPSKAMKTSYALGVTKVGTKKELRFSIQCSPMIYFVDMSLKDQTYKVKHIKEDDSILIENVRYKDRVIYYRILYTKECVVQLMSGGEVSREESMTTKYIDYLKRKREKTKVKPIIVQDKNKTYDYENLDALQEKQSVNKNYSKIILGE